MRANHPAWPVAGVVHGRDSPYIVAMQTITKIDAARRQLNVAVKLWLDEDDLAAVQTLAWAALTILRDLTKAAGRTSPVTKTPHDFDREAANFLKHADRDPGAWLIEIDPFIPEIAFHEAIGLYRTLTGSTTREMTVAQRVIDMKYGFGDYLGGSADRRREEDRERERVIGNILDDEDRKRAQQQLDNDRRIRQSGLLTFGRSVLTGEPLFPASGE